MKKNLLNIDIVRIIDWYNNNTSLSCLPLKPQWTIRKNIKVLNNVADEIKKFQSELQEQFRAEWFTEEKTDEVEIPELNEDGTEKKDEDGNVLTQQGMKIKSEFIDDFKKSEAEANKKLEELFLQSNELELIEIDIDSIVESLPNDTKITMDDLDVLMVFCCK